jgi:hypothetical protein
MVNVYGFMRARGRQTRRRTFDHRSGYDRRDLAIDETVGKLAFPATQFTYLKVKADEIALVKSTWRFRSGMPVEISFFGATRSTFDDAPTIGTASRETEQKILAIDRPAFHFNPLLMLKLTGPLVDMNLELRAV